MKTTLSLVLTSNLILLLGVLGALQAEEGDSLWSCTFGGSGGEGVNSVIETNDGGFLLAGYTYSFGSGEGDMWLVKTDAQGDSLWSRTFGGSEWEGANSVIETGDGGFLLAGCTYSFGSGEHDMWLVKTDAQGDSLWSRTFGGGEEESANSVIETGDGGFLLAGYTYSFGSGCFDMWLVKTNAQGDSLWSRTFGGVNYELAFSVIETSDGGFLLAGYTGSFGSGSDDMWLVKTDAQGDSLWSRTFGGSEWEYANSVIVTGDGGFLLAGYTMSFGSGMDDMWLVKTDAQGDSLWSRTFGGGEVDLAFSVIEAGDSGFLLAGFTSSFGSWGDMWLVKTDAQGDSLWSRTFGGGRGEYANSVIVTSDGDFLLAGNTESFGSGSEDMWLVCVEGITPAVHPQSQVPPPHFTLYPVYPNPFNPTTTLSFELPVASWVTLEIYGISGRLVGAGFKPAPTPGSWYPPGIHRISLDGSGLASGVYIYRLNAGDYKASGKMVLMK